MSQEETPETEDGFFAPPGRDLAAIDRWLNERGLTSPTRSGLSALIQGEPAPTVAPSDRRFGTLPWLLRDAIPGALGAGGRMGIDFAEDVGRSIVGAEALPAPEDRLSAYLIPRTAPTEFAPGGRSSARAGSTALRGRVQGGRINEMAGDVEEQAPTDWLAQAFAYQNQFAPDYSGIAQGWADEGNLVNQRLQAMYDQIAERAGENVGRIQDIYGGATAGIGQAYDTGVGNVEQAYSSAQQQAADQLARLGIEEAAPTILDPMALSQAESVAGLEAGRAAGLGATERYGASSGDFASQMAQVAQQEGAQYQTGVADALRRQLMNLEMQQQQEAYNRAMQAPELAQQLAQASQIGQPQGLSFEQQLALDRFAFEQAQAAEEISRRLPQAEARRYAELFEAYGKDSAAALEALEFERAQGLIG
jgi:hypothetical protein